jgi:hypothetical protein
MSFGFELKEIRKKGEQEKNMLPSSQSQGKRLKEERRKEKKDETTSFEVTVVHAAMCYPEPIGSPLTPPRFP